MDTSLYHIECFVLTCALCGLALLLACRGATRLCDGLRLEASVLAGLAARIAIMLLVAALGASGETLRGSDDAAFLHAAQTLTDGPFSAADWLETGSNELHTVTMAVQLALLGDAGDLSLRLVQITAALLGLIAMTIGVGILAGNRAALIFAWIAMLEPSNAFFSTLLHKESFVILGGGLVFLALALASRRDLRHAIPVAALGFAITATTRLYVAFALALGIGLTALHVALRERVGSRRAIGLMAVVVVGGLGVGVVAAPTVVPERLASLQFSQDYQPPRNANLQLGRVDVTTSEGLARMLVTRSADFTLRPYPWEIANLSQKLGSTGTLIWLALALGLIGTLALFRARRTPVLIYVIYLSLVQLFVYVVTLNNAAQGYRHRIHLLLLVAAAVAIAWRRLPESSVAKWPALARRAGVERVGARVTQAIAWRPRWQTASRARRETGRSARPVPRRARVGAAATAAGALVAFLVAVSMSDTYEASATIVVNESTVEIPAVGLPYVQPNPRSPLTSEIALLPGTRGARRDIAARVQVGVGSAALSDVASTTDVEDADEQVVLDRLVAPVRTIVVRAHQPTRRLAQRVAALYARELIAWRGRTVIASLRRARDALRLRSIASPSDRRLRADVQRADAVLAAETKRLRPAVRTTAAEEPVSPRVWRDVVIGGLAGAALWALAVAARRQRDRSVRARVAAYAEST